MSTTASCPSPGSGIRCRPEWRTRFALRTRRPTVLLRQIADLAQRQLGWPVLLVMDLQYRDQQADPSDSVKGPGDIDVEPAGTRCVAGRLWTRRQAIPRGQRARETAGERRHHPGPRWIMASGDPFRPPRLCAGSEHGSRPGVVDERARRLSHEEMAVAGRLASEGHHVRSLPEGRGRGRVADLEACGVAVEVKSWLSLTERNGRAPSPRSVLNKLVQAGRQAPTVVLNGYGTGLTVGVARLGMALYSARPDAGLLSSVRVLGDGFDLAWTRRPELAIGHTDPKTRTVRPASRRYRAGEVVPADTAPAARSCPREPDG